MKVIKIVLFALGCLLVAQSFLSACPTCINKAVIGQINTETTKQKLPEQQATVKIAQKTGIIQQIDGAGDGYTSADKRILTRLKKQAAVTQKKKLDTKQ